MKTTAFYSIVQFCPDRLKEEVVNVGVIVCAPGTGERAVHMAQRNEHVRRTFGDDVFDDAWLSVAKAALVERLQDSEPTLEALSSFIAQEAGYLLLTPPRIMIVGNLSQDSLDLFRQLVNDPYRD